eukprot:COSAG05_NODE_581_length_8548_cov_3.360279_6_plen_211_part_00
MPPASGQQDPMADAPASPTGGESKRVPSPMQSPTKYDFNSSSLENVFIGISGMIGAGKSTLAKALAEKLDLPVHYEPVVDNVYLEDFYGDMAKYSFQLQVYLLNRRFKQQQQIVWQGMGGVQDRTIYEDSVFAKMLHDSGHMDDRDYATYLDLFKNMSNFMKKPNISELHPRPCARRALSDRFVLLRCSRASRRVPRGIHEAHHHEITGL